MGAAYSSIDRAKVLYATSLVLLGAKAKLLRRKPSVLVVLEEISETCWPKSVLSVMVIPRYFADWTLSKVWLCSEKSRRICLWCWCRVTLIDWHLATLNFICQSASHCPKLVRSSCKIKQSWSECIFLYETQSSANRRTEDLMLSGRSFMIRNRTRPTADPWGTPDSTGTGSEAWPSKTTCWVRPESHELIHLLGWSSYSIIFQYV